VIFTTLPERLEELVLDVCFKRLVLFMILQAKILHGGGNDVVLSDLEIVM
jgi:hypothetical protein